MATIREYKPEDKEAVGQCSLELLESQHQNQPEFWSSSKEVTGDSCVDALLNQTKDGKGKIFVAEEEGVVVGYVCTTMNEIDDEPGFIAKQSGHISDVAVLKEFRGKGIASQLMMTAEEYAKERGCMYTSLVVATGNSAINLYRKLGYETKSEIMRKIL